MSGGIKHVLNRLRKSIINLSDWNHDIDLDKNICYRQLNHTNPFVKYGRKGFSQTDEDGLTLEIIRRIGIANGTFAEIGVGKGLENNTLALLGMGWRGFWLGNEKLAFDISKSKRLSYCQDWVSLENINQIYNREIEKLNAEQVDVISLDVDGNDFHFCEKLLNTGHRPSLFIVEYNGRFPPPIRFIMPYNESHIWKKDDYYGASLMSLVELLDKYEYQLICCNAATGVNAFFVLKSFADKFPEVPKEISKIYVTPHFWPYKVYGHHISPKTIEVLIS